MNEDSISALLKSLEDLRVASDQAKQLKTESDEKNTRQTSISSGVDSLAKDLLYEMEDSINQYRKIGFNLSKNQRSTISSTNSCTKSQNNDDPSLSNSSKGKLKNIASTLQSSDFEQELAHFDNDYIENNDDKDKLQEAFKQMESIKNLNISSQISKSIDKNGSPLDIVNRYLCHFKEVKQNLHFCGTSNQIIQVKALTNFDAQSIYSKEQSSTMLSFGKFQDLIILGKINAEWVIGYKPKELNFEEQKEEIGILPLNYVKLQPQLLPKPIRHYQIQNWNTFGLDLNLQPTVNIPTSIEQILEKEAQNQQKSKLDDVIISLDLGSRATPIMICQASHDFNSHSKKSFVFNNTPILYFKKDSILIATTLPNQAGWCEGYTLYSERVCLGIFPIEFTEQIKFKS